MIEVRLKVIITSTGDHRFKILNIFVVRLLFFPSTIGLVIGKPGPFL